MTTPSMFATCPLPGCNEPTPDPREVCEACRKAFGEFLRPLAADAPRLGPDEYAAALAERDRAVLAAYDAQRAPAPDPAPERGVWRRNQHCWVCDERPRSCHPDPGFPDRWICRNCSREDLA